MIYDDMPDDTTLVKQASTTADDYMMKAKWAIDDLFGDGYAKQHPELVAAFMTTAANDFNTAMWTKALRAAIPVLERLAECDESL